jgi:hypothetical protein
MMAKHHIVKCLWLPGMEAVNMKLLLFMKLKNNWLPNQAMQKEHVFQILKRFVYSYDKQASRKYNRLLLFDMFRINLSGKLHCIYCHVTLICTCVVITDSSACVRRTRYFVDSIMKWDQQRLGV